ncbi:MAG: helix-turn-helix domain-containing protein [Acidobacteriaceae bacterium]|nr:helix-turn-helix domain-containing protein [Acidobacteriaceae bacterium]
MQYSDDLRQRLVEAWQAGHGTQAELAEWFGVSLRWVEKVLARWRRTGQTAARPFRHGPPPSLPLTRLERLVQQHPAATLAELGGRFQAGRIRRPLPSERRHGASCPGTLGPAA